MTDANRTPGQPKSGSFNHNVTQVTIKDPGSELGIAGNVSYGMSRAGWYIRHMPLLIQRSVGALGAGLGILFIVAFTLNVVFPRNPLSSFLTRKVPASIIEGGAEGIRGIAGGGSDLAENTVNQIVPEAIPEVAPATPQEETSFPTGLQPSTVQQ